MSSSALPGLDIGTRLITPADEDYDAVRQPWNLAVDQRPAAVALPSDAAQVAQVVRAARAAGLRVAVQGGAHNPGPLGDLGDALLLRTSAMSGVRIDAASRIARVEAGALWDPVIAAAAEHGLYPLHGSSPNVGVVGYSLGGGLGWAARRHGLQANQIVAAELVTADGELLRVDADHAPDLFWALRGGGGGFGVVTALEFTLLPIRTAYAGWLAWDWTESERVLTAWAEWAQNAPEAVTSSARIIKLPPLPDVPEPIRGRQLVAVDGAVLGTSDEEAAARLTPLRALRPEIDTFGRMPATALARLHADPEQPTPVVSDTAMLGPLDASRDRVARRRRRPAVGLVAAAGRAAPARRRARAPGAGRGRARRARRRLRALCPRARARPREPTGRNCGCAHPDRGDEAVVARAPVRELRRGPSRCRRVP